MEKINSYTEGYNKGYFKALLDIQSCIDSFDHSPYVSRCNQKYNAVKSLFNIFFATFPIVPLYELYLRLGRTILIRPNCFISL